MATTHNEDAAQWRTTIIISTSLENHETIRMLRGQQHRIRFTDSVEAGAFIFPLSAPNRLKLEATKLFHRHKVQTGTAFLLVDPQDPQHQESVLVERLSKFAQVHRNCFVLLHAPFNGPKEMDTFSLIQHRFFGGNLQILPVRRTVDILKGMLTIAKATSKPHVDNIRDRMSLARAHIIENSPVWEMLRDMM